MHCDRARIAQLLSNLLGNAITHEASDRPIHVAASVTYGVFRLKVANEGRPISADRIPELFTAFSKLENEPHREGLGLGLYIASEIAKAHGGVMTASSDAEKTVFPFEMPASDETKRCGAGRNARTRTLINMEAVTEVRRPLNHSG
ncbi:sensor histidine kinase [Paracoccus benzoatiresistens]|uniref:sensor histidine kinase n=1 Tax=Paracoccus benzoatiresistens TaxID=2997341 RepID=UPI00352FF589